MEVKVPMDIRPGELRCPACFGRDVVNSLRRGWLDALMLRAGREPRQCRFCGKRFYVEVGKEGEAGDGG